MAYNASTTFGEIIKISSDVLAKNDVIDIGKRQVAKIFLEKLLDKAKPATFDELESEYRACSPAMKIPKESEKFWTYIEKNYLYLESEPKDKLIDLLFDVIEDLGKVSENLKSIQKELEALENKKLAEGRLTADERYYRNQLEYFREKNLSAKNEIVDFMTYRAKGYAIEQSSASPLRNYTNTLNSILGRSKPYSFGRKFSDVLPDPYDFNGLDTYSNKFTDLPLSFYKQVVDQLRISPEKFKEFATSYIAGNDHIPSVRSKLERLVGKSHILSSRKEIINAMLKHFESKDFISFVSMAPLQIEGIFADICREVGVSENQLDISSLNDKLQHIEGKVRKFFFFEYYSFKFPVLRNLVAHGGLVDGEMEDTAIHLLLDLLPVCELSESEELPINHAINVLRQAKEHDMKSLVEWIELREKVIIPDFYDIKNDIPKIETQYLSQVFWDYLQVELEKLDDVKQVKNSKPTKVAGLIKRRDSSNSMAAAFLKKASKITSNAVEKRNARKILKTLIS